jgi:Protein of unknown function (DUF2459)
MMRFALLPLLLLLLQACSGMLQRAASANADRAGPPKIIYVARRGWHIDVGFATSDIEPPLASTLGYFPSSGYLFFGFGDKHYLVAKHKYFPGILAALWPGEGMLLATALVATPEQAFGNEHVVRLTVSAAQLRAAQAFVWNSLLNEHGAPALYGDGPYAGGLFFGAAANYSAVYTCNTWAAEVLQAAGLPVHHVGIVFATQLWSQVRRIDTASHPRISARLAPVAASAPVRLSIAEAAT